MRANTRFDRFVFEEYRTSATNLAIYRILYAAMILLVYLPQNLWISSFPSSFFNPPMGITVLFTGFPSASLFILINAAFILAACCLLVGYRTRRASIAVVLCILVSNSWASSFGKVAGDLALVLAPIALQASGWGEKYSYDASMKSPMRHGNNAWPVAFLALLLGLSMMGAAAAKAAGGWLNPQTHAVLGNILPNYFTIGRSNSLVTHMLDIKSGTFWEFLDYATVLLEASFLLAVGSSRAFRIVCAAACFFHFGTGVVMEIPYWPNVLAYGAFCDWSRAAASPLVKKGLAALPRLFNDHPLLKLILCSVAICLMYATVGNPLQRLAMVFRQDWNVALGLLICLVSIGIAARFLVGQVRIVLVDMFPGRTDAR